MPKNIFRCFGLLFSLFFFLSINVSAANIDPVFLKTFNKVKEGESYSFIIKLKDNAPIILNSKNPIIRLKSIADNSQASVLKLLRKNKGIKKTHSLWLNNSIFVETNSKSIINELKKYSQVEKIIPNKIYLLPEISPKKVTNNITPLSATVEDNIVQIKADQVWVNYNDSSGNPITGKGVRVAILDSGITLSHPDLINKTINQAKINTAGAVESAVVTDDSGHGTHVAGIIAGGNSSGKYIGVAPQTDLMIAKVFEYNASIGDYTATFAQIVGGMEWALDPDGDPSTDDGAKIINMSLGNSNPLADTNWIAPIDRVINANVIPVVAIGNLGPGSDTTTSPGNVINALAVGSVGNAGNVSSFSSRGPVTWSSVDYIKPDFAAPGESIKSAWNDGTYRLVDGTSQATPHLAGTLALMMQMKSSLSISQIKQILQSTTQKNSGITYPNNNYGYGLIDALQALASTVGPDNDPPSISHTAITTATYGQSINISTTVIDNQSANPVVTIQYRRVGETAFTAIALSQSGNTFTGAIPASVVDSDIEYFIKAEDAAQNVAYYPTTAPSNPFTITVTPTTATRISRLLSYPNPFRLSSSSNIMLTFYLSKASSVTIHIYDLSGNMIKQISLNGTFSYNSVNWDGISDMGGRINAGVYLYKITASDSQNKSLGTGKIVVIQ